MSAPFRRVTDDFWVAPQITPADVQTAAAQGVRLILNNRPEGEEPGQPTGEQIEAAAQAAGVTYVAVPIVGRPNHVDLEIISAALAEADGTVLAYCRSGTRSILAWAAAQAISGARTRADVVALARDAGYDLSMYL
jgi:uncharacterized protein (TIGR01244 family)